MVWTRPDKSNVSQNVDILAVKAASLFLYKTPRNFNLNCEAMATWLHNTVIDFQGNLSKTTVTALIFGLVQRDLLDSS